MIPFYAAVALILIAILSAYSFVCIKIWKKWKYGKYIVVAFSLYMFFEIFWAIYPQDSFYSEMYEEVSGEKFPAESEIIKGYASFPDIHGDYDACAYIKIKHQSLLTKEWKIKPNESSDIGCLSCDKISKFAGNPNFKRLIAHSDSTSLFRYIGVITDSTLIACRSSS